MCNISGKITHGSPIKYEVMGLRVKENKYKNTLAEYETNTANLFLHNGVGDHVLVSGI